MPVKQPKFWGIQAKPTTRLGLILALIPFLLLLSSYLFFSYQRRAENPHDKILPSAGQMVSAVHRLAFNEDERTGEYLMAKDTISSLTRLFTGLGLSAFVGLMLGLNMGIFAGCRSILLAFVTFLSIIPPLAILPILFIAFGVDEFAKIMLIFLGTFPLITRDIFIATSKTPREQITKSLTLGASPLRLTYGIVLPQIMPRLIDTVRLSFGAGWLFLIASEAIASTDGLGYRIFLVRRYLAMDVIIPYAIWITVLGYFFDLTLRKTIDWKFKWYRVAKG